MSKTISGLPIAETLTGDELLPVVQDGNTVQATVEQVVALVGNTVTWGNIEGTLSNQTDLQTALDNKYSTSNPAGYIIASALTGYAPLNSPTFTGTVGGITKSMVGLGNVDNTADANKSVNYANTAGSASNSDTVDGYHIQVDGTGTNPNTIYFKTTGGVDPSQAIWGDITGSIVDQTDLYNALVTGSYATGNWNINASSVDGYSVQVDGTGTDPNTIYFKTTGGTISVDWDDVANTPTTVSGYGVTDAVTTSGNQTIGGTKTFSSTITGSITGNADTVDGYHVQVDGTGTDPNTIYFKTTGGTTSVAWGNISGTLSAQTDLQTALDGKYSTSNPSGYITASALTPYAPINNPTFTGTVSGITKAMVGLGNVDNTADAVKSVSYATSSGNADTVDGYNVQVDGTGTDPNTIYFKTTGGSVSVEWDDVSNTPTTVAGYGITDAVTTSGNQTIAGVKNFTSNVGIGTASPQRTLQITATEPSIVFEETDQTTDEKRWRMYGTGSDFAIGAVNDAFTVGATAYTIARGAGTVVDNHRWTTSNVERMRITSTGNVGIGTASPSGILDASGSAPVVYITNTSTSAWGTSGLYFKTATVGIAKILAQRNNLTSGGYLLFNTTTDAGVDTERMRIDSTGNVGIGTASPAFTGLTISGKGNPSVGIEYFETGTGGASYIGRKARGTQASPSAVGNNDYIATLLASGYKATAWSGNAGLVGFRASENFTNTATGTYFVVETVTVGGTARTERMRIDDAGLDVVGDIGATGAIFANGIEVGYRDIPTTVSNATKTFALADAGKGFGKDNTTAYTYTIPANASVAFPIGTVITVFNNGGSANITIAITTDTMYLAGTATTGSRTLAFRGVCTLYKVSATVWLASGAGLT